LTCDGEQQVLATIVVLDCVLREREQVQAVFCANL
jgi:hypothetical protein